MQNTRQAERTVDIVGFGPSLSGSIFDFVSKNKNELTFFEILVLVRL